MDIDRYSAICSIFGKLRSFPIFDFFWENNTNEIQNPEASRTITFSIISAKLERCSYEDIDSFCSDVETCLENAIISNDENSLRVASARQLLKIFNDHIKEFNIHSNNLIMATSYFISNYKNKNLLPIIENKKTESLGDEPGSELFIQNIGDDIIAVYRYLKMVSSTSLLYEVLAFLNQVQKDSTIVSDDSIVIDIYKISQENRVALVKFLQNLLKSSAKHEIKPFTRPFGQESQPKRLIHIGFSENIKKSVPIS